MSIVNYNKYSPYHNTPQTSWYLSNWSPIDIGSDITDTLLELKPKYKYRPDLLAYDLYGTVNLWWVFMSRNPDVIVDPVFNMIPGVILYIPSSTRVSSILGV